jgi:hypothetical protein
MCISRPLSGEPGSRVRVQGVAELRRYPGVEADSPCSRGERRLGRAEESSVELESCAQGDGTDGDADDVGLEWL